MSRPFVLLTRPFEMPRVSSSPPLAARRSSHYFGRAMGMLDLLVTLALINDEEREYWRVRFEQATWGRRDNR